MKTKCLDYLGFFLILSVSLFGCGGGGGSSAPPPAPPSAPTNLVANAGNGAVGLTWTAVSGAASYNVYRGTASGVLSTKTKIATGLASAAYSDSAVTNGTTYYYQVTAVNANGESSGSSEVNAAPQANLPPVAPTNLVATAGNGTVELTWNIVAGATSYSIYRSTVSGSLGTKTNIATLIASAIYIDSAAINGTTYYYQVTAVNANGESGGSNEAIATPSAPSTAPYITAQAITWASAPPAGFPVLEVEVCTDSSCSTHINNATVTINSTTLSYNATEQRYEASGPMPTAGAAVNLSVTIPGGWPVAAGTYTASGTQYTVSPSVTSPTASTTWDPAVSNTVTWTAGSPTAASDYVVGIIDDFGNFYPINANNNPVSVPTSGTSYILPANSITTPGTYSVFAGIGTHGIINRTSGISISGAAAGSGLWIASVSSIVSFQVGTPPSAGPYIFAQAITWATSPPAGFPVLVVEVYTDSNYNTPINNATVTINSTTLSYNAIDEQYEASGPMPAAGAAVNLSVTVPGGWPVAAGTYTASGTQYTTFPSVTSPTAFATWDHTAANTVTWTAGSPTTASNYVVGIMNDLGDFYPVNANNNPVSVPTSITSYTLPANSITTPGGYAVFVGIGTQGIAGGTGGGISISGAAAGSGLWIGGVSDIVPITVN